MSSRRAGSAAKPGIVLRVAGDEDIDVVAFARAFQDLAEAVGRVAPRAEAPFAQLLNDHLGQDPSDLPVVSMNLADFDHANLQRAVDALAEASDVEVDRVVGIRGQHRMFGGLTLSMLTQQQLNLEIGPVDYVELAVDTAQTLTCIDFGLMLLRVGGDPFAALVRSADQRTGQAPLTIEVIGRERTGPAGLLSRLRALMTEHNVFRQKVVSLAPAGNFSGSIKASFIERPGLGRQQVILPEGVLEQVERLTIDFSARAASLLAGGRHLRRGVLLHGQPGTGKTHTIRYLMSQLTDRTVFVLSGQGLGVISHTVELARVLQPSIVVLEDVDLVAEERTRPHAGTNPILFELLNQMDGVENDADIVFILTTNRPDLLEPALASRPGRIDLAIEIPLPAAAERLRLLDLYAEGLQLELSDWAAIVERTDGSSAAFLRELLRQAALEGAGTGSEPPVITEGVLLGTLATMAHADRAMTARLLGSNRPS